MNEFTERLIQARKDKNMTQKELAETLEISPTRLNYWEKGKAEPDVHYIFKLCDALGVSGDWLLGISDEKKPVADKGNELERLRDLVIKKVMSLDENLLKGVLEYAEFLSSRHGE